MALDNDDKKLLALVAAAGGVAGMAGIGYVYYRNKSVEEARAKSTKFGTPYWDQKLKQTVIPTEGGGI